MNTLDIEALLVAPTFDSIGVLTIEALAPLSMVVQMPGKYYRSQSAPSHPMLYGLLENALGWHLGEKDRSEILKNIQKRHGITEEVHLSGVGFRSLLQFHVRIGTAISESAATMLRYDDLWSQHLRTGGLEFFGGSREHDARLIPLVNAASVKGSKVKLTDSGGRRDEDAIENFKEEDTISLTLVRPFFPRYYVTPTAREYVEPSVAYRYRIETSAYFIEQLGIALNDPIAPLYLGSNDGWVEATISKLSEPSK